MAAPSSGRNTPWEEAQLRHRRDREKRAWRPPPAKRSVPVIYYLSRNGHLEHPHFMEVPLSSPPDGLLLRDVIDRFNALRGKAMASMYSWSCKRSYKNGYVWHDLSDTDVVYSAGNHEYVLKGSELPPEDTPPSLPPPRRRNRSQSHSCSSIDFEIRAASARAVVEKEISPPPSDSSPETLETLMGLAKGRPTATLRQGDTETAEKGAVRCGRSPSVLMQLISCGSVPFKDCGPGPIGGHGRPSSTRARHVGEKA